MPWIAKVLSRGIKELANLTRAKPTQFLTVIEVKAAMLVKHVQTAPVRLNKTT